MKYVIILPDGMADEPIQQLNGKTPLEYAKTPAMDALAAGGTIGTVTTVPNSLKPGSDVANLSVLGYNPALCYSGRSPLEALSVGVSMRLTDVVYRCNLVTLTEEEPYVEKRILDHSSGEISTEEADELMESIRQAFNDETFSFYTGTSYRQITIWDKGQCVDLEPPHDHLGKVIGPFLPEQPQLRAMMEKSYDILNQHPVNLRRAAQGKNKANSLWFWGAGNKPSLQNFTEKTGLRGAMVSAVDLLKGIAVGTGIRVVNVPGANGTLETNYRGKGEAAVKALLEDGLDFVYVHIEAPDEMGHQGKLNEKIRSIELIDEQVVSYIWKQLEASGEEYRILIMPDHPTPLRCRTHTMDPVPYLLYDSRSIRKNPWGFSEREAAAARNYIADGYKLSDILIKGE